MKSLIRPMLLSALVLTMPLIAQDLGRPTLWQVNQANSSLDMNGDMVTAPGLLDGNATTATLEGQYVAATLNAPAGMGYDVLIVAAEAVPNGHPNAMSTVGGQIINVNLADPSATFLNGGLGPVFTAHPGMFTLHFSAPRAPLAVAAQQVVTDPASVDGLTLSQASELHVLNQITVPGPTGDDASVLVDLTPLGGNISFLNRNYATLGVESNGRVVLGGTDADATASVSDAMTGLPFAGYWTDLDPSAGGSIDIIDTGAGLTVQYNAVPYFGELTTVSFSIVFNRSTRTVRITGLRGITANPGNAVTSLDASFLGFSPGSSASSGSAIDRGTTLFGLGGAGSTNSRDEMLYDFQTPVGAMGSPTILAPSLQAGTLHQLVSTTVLGLTTWIGF